MGLEYTVRPLSAPVPIKRVSAPFKAAWSDTLELLEREQRELGAKRVILEADVRERDIRLDGRMRADAKPATDAVAIVLLGTKAGGDMRLAAHLETSSWAFTWQANVRAIALTLEALRRVHRYGTAPSSEQYAGFRALPAGGQTLADVVELGWKLIDAAGSYRKALALHHPDNDGAHDDFVAVQTAMEAGRP